MEESIIEDVAIAAVHSPIAMYKWVTLIGLIRLFKAPKDMNSGGWQIEETWKVGWEMRSTICSYLIVNMYKA